MGDAPAEARLSKSGHLKTGPVQGAKESLQELRKMDGV